MTFSRNGQTTRLALHFEWTDSGLSAVGLGSFERLLFTAHWGVRGTALKKAAFAGLPFDPGRLAGDFLLLRGDSRAIQEALGSGWAFAGTGTRRAWSHVDGRDTLYVDQGDSGSVEMRSGRGSKAWSAQVHVTEISHVPASDCRVHSDSAREAK